MLEVTVDLVYKGDAAYQSVAGVASDVYEEILGLKPLELPKCFIEIFYRGKPVGGAGLNHAEEQHEQLWVEAFCALEESSREKMEDFLRLNKSEDRSSWSEITCFHVVAEFRHVLVTIVLAYTFLYLFAIRRKTTLNIQAGTLDRTLRKMGIEFEKFNSLGKDFPVDAPSNFKNAFLQNYVGRTRPHCSGINVAQAAKAAERYLKSLQELIIVTGPALHNYLELK